MLACLGILAGPANLHAQTEADLTPFEASYTAAMERGSPSMVLQSAHLPPRATTSGFTGRMSIPLS